MNKVHINLTRQNIVLNIKEKNFITSFLSDLFINLTN